MTCLLLVTPHKYGAAVNNSEDPWRAFVSMMVLRGKWLLLNSHQRVLVLLGDVNIMNHTIKPTPLCLCRMFTVKCTLKKLPASKKNYGYSEGTDGLEKEIYTYRAMCVCVCVLFVCSIMPGACYSLPILICHSAFPPFWSWVKYLNSYLMNCQHILVERLAVTRWWIPLTLMISRPFKWHPYESDNLTVFISFFGGGLSRFVTHHHDVRGFSQGCLWSTGFSSCVTGTSIFLIIV